MRPASELLKTQLPAWKDQKLQCELSSAWHFAQHSAESEALALESVKPAMFVLASVTHAPSPSRADTCCSLASVVGTR